MRRRVWMVVAALAAIACLIAVGVRLSVPTLVSTVAPAPTTTEPPPVAPTVRSRIKIPRPVKKPPPDLPDDTDLDRIAEDHTDVPSPVDTDTFPAVQGVKADLGQQLRSSMKEVNGDLVGCLHGWSEAQPGTFEGRAVFAFHLDKEGLAELEVLDVQTIPEQTLSCLGDVLWEEVEWPAVQDPVDVTWPIQVSIDPKED